VKRERLSTAETLAWSAVGIAAGVMGGLWAAGWVGRMTRARLAGGFRAMRAPRATTAVALAAAVRRALAADPVLAPHELTPIPVSHATVELTGWVPDRATRARAVRVAGAVSGLDDLINSVLVHGEDDLRPVPELTLEGRSA
jgi:hypothetical protein